MTKMLDILEDFMFVYVVDDEDVGHLGRLPGARGVQVRAYRRRHHRLTETGRHRQVQWWVTHWAALVMLVIVRIHS